MIQVLKPAIFASAVSTPREYIAEALQYAKLPTSESGAPAGNTIFFRNGLHYLIYPIGHEVRNLWMKKWPST
jgi:hypothetical protein